MLTREALVERKWKPYPALRIVLEDKSVDSRYYGPTSVSDNIFSQMSRLIEVAILIVEHNGDIKNAARPIGTDNLCKDLYSVLRELEAGSKYLLSMHESVQKVLHDVAAGRAIA